MRNRSTEDYLKTICQLEHNGDPVSTSALAGRLGLASASITDMLKKLSSQGLVHYRRYRGVTLTHDGRRIAMKTMRRHRLWEMFLVRHLGFSWDRVHDEAERLEHVTSDALERELDRVLGYPTEDPHGDPIPTAGGAVRGQVDLQLADCIAGARVTIRRVSDRNAGMLQHAADMGLGLNTTLVVAEKKEFDGSMVVRVGSKRRFLSREMAEALFVKRVREKV